MEDHQGQRGRTHIAVKDLTDEVQEWASDKHFHEMQALCVGARVMLTDNMVSKFLIEGGGPFMPPQQTQAMTTTSSLCCHEHRRNPAVSTVAWAGWFT